MEACQNFADSAQNQNAGGVAVDSRYQNIANVDTLPNQYDIEKESGVFDTLKSLPAYSSYVPNAKRRKEGYSYDLWARPTLQYDANCATPINKAISMLSDLPDSIGGDVDKDSIRTV